VTVRYQVLTGFMASEVVDVITYRDGHHDAVLQGLIHVPQSDIPQGRHAAIENGPASCDCQSR
jgi:hypothetical protein